MKLTLHDNDNFSGGRAYRRGDVPFKPLGRFSVGAHCVRPSVVGTADRAHAVRPYTRLRQRFGRSLALQFLLLAAATVASAQEFAAFRVISQRNVFNQNRVARGRDGAVTKPSRAVSLDAFSLVGTLYYETNQIAFFDGSRAEYRKAVRPSDTIAGHKLVAIQPDSVRLEAAGKTVVMKIGAKLQRPSETAPIETAPETNAVAPAVEHGADASEVLKKLMQRREQETK